MSIELSTEISNFDIDLDRISMKDHCFLRRFRLYSNEIEVLESVVELLSTIESLRKLIFVHYSDRLPLEKSFLRRKAKNSIELFIYPMFTIDELSTIVK